MTFNEEAEETKASLHDILESKRAYLVFLADKNNVNKDLWDDEGFKGFIDDLTFVLLSQYMDMEGKYAKAQRFREIMGITGK